MDYEFWNGRWEQGQIGFHQERINPYLERHWRRVAAHPGARVLVPLCGKSRDMVWLAAQGHEVVGVEMVALGIQAFFAEQALAPARSREGAFEVWRAGPYTLLCGDFFETGPEVLGRVDAVYDRASLIALPPDLRPRYAAHLAALLPAGGGGLLVTMDYPQHEMQGPPFAVTEAEVRALYADCCDVEAIDCAEILTDNTHFLERGLSRLEERTYLLRRR